MFCLRSPLVPKSPPENITVHNTSSTSIRVAWDPVPKSLAQGIILGYRIFLTGTQQQGPLRRKRSVSPIEIVFDTANLTTEFQHLEKYSNYCVEAVAYTRIGESNRTNATCVLTDEDGKHTETFLFSISFWSCLSVVQECTKS